MTDADVTIRSDHLPLKKFLNKQTMNSKVNNWLVELEQFQLQLDWIPGSCNLLVDSLSLLLDVLPDAQQADEAKDEEFESYCFEELEPAKTLEIVATEVIELQVEAGETVHSSQISWKLTKTNECKEEVTDSNKEKTKTPVEGSEFSKYLQNSWILNKVGIFELKYDEQPLKKPSLLNSSKSGKHSQNSQTDFRVKITEHEEVKEINLPLKPGQLHELQKKRCILQGYC